MSLRGNAGTGREYAQILVTLTSKKRFDPKNTANRSTNSVISGILSRMHRILLLVLTGALAGGCSMVAPAHVIPVRADYIEAGVEVGDTLEVTTSDGTETKITVVNVTADYIEGPDGRIAIGDIQGIVKRSFELPGHPCGANEPVGCSIPEIVLLLSEKYKEQAEKFHPACVKHDFCYRHGYATYGVDREQCDASTLR